MRLTAPLACAAALSLGGCMTTAADGSPEVQTTSDANREDLPGAMKAPLRDVNVLRTKVPEVLLQAMADPYARPTGARCPALAVQVRSLDAALGADLDQHPDEPSVSTVGRTTTLGVVARLASSAVPFRGWVRALSGAERHDNFVQAAIEAGLVRRAYLKGLGEAAGCPPPATPSHERAGSEVPTQNAKPRYPTRTPDAPAPPSRRAPAYPTR